MSDGPSKCRHGLLESDFHFTYFEIALGFITAIDFILLIYYVMRFKCMKEAYETLLKKTDDEMAELKKLQETTSMQVIVPLLYLRKWKRMVDFETTVDSIEMPAEPKTPANGVDDVHVEQTQVSSIGNGDEN
uniref:Uncharacterized protein n=1 Tax=Haemonchus contortus TaxID=6289 RepID=A0A7I4Y0Z8_HAECO